MSDQKEEMKDEKQGRVQMNDLAQKEEELKAEEARAVKGGGGLAGGIVNRNGISEDIPQ